MDRGKRIKQALRALDDFRRDVRELGADEVNCDELEQRLQGLLNAVGCELMGEVLERADTTAPMLEYDGQRWGNRRESRSTYTSKFGDVDVVRSIYSRGGGGRVLVPLDLRLGIVERRYTPALGRVMTRAIALMTSQDAEGFLQETGVAMVSRSTLHRVPQAVAARYELQREAIEQALREGDSVPEGATVVQIGLDGAMVPQEGDGEKPRGRKVESNQPARHEQRYGAMAKEVPAEQEDTEARQQRDTDEVPTDEDDTAGRSWHEAMVGTVAYWNAAGEHLKTIYLARMPESGHETIALELDKELHAALSERPDLDVSFASDGDALQWIQLEGIAVGLPENDNRRSSFNLDFYHAASYVHAAAKAAFPESPPAAEVQAEQWKSTLKEYEDGAARVLKSMRYFRDGIDDPERRDAMVKAIRYLAKQAKAGRMNYKTSLDLGHPIGTGPTEAAAKTIVNVRMKRAGARYSQHGGQTILTFRAALYAERFDALWVHLHSSYKGQVTERAA